MRFLCDVHISYKVVNLFEKLGYEAIHVNQILQKSETKDADICKYADNNNYIVVSKDVDFKDSFIINRTPKKLLRICLGNISNELLIHLLMKAESKIQEFKKYEFVMIEIDQEGERLFLP